MTIALDSIQNVDALPLRGSPLSARNVCERALRKVRAYAINDAGADADEMEEALEVLDLLVKHVAGTQTCYWLRPDTVTFSWPLNADSVVLADAMGSGYPSLGVQFPVGAWLIDGNTGDRWRTIELCRREKYERRKSFIRQGSPEMLYIDRRVEKEKAFVWPVPDVASTTDPSMSNWQIALEFQTYTRSVMGTQGGEDSGEIAHGFAAGWELFLVTRLAAEIGDGPVKQLDRGTLQDWRRLADGYLSDLNGFSNKEKTTRRPVTRRYGG